MCHFDELEKKLKSILVLGKGERIIDLRNPPKKTITGKNFKKLYKKLHYDEEEQLRLLESDKTIIN